MEIHLRFYDSRRFYFVHFTRYSTMKRVHIHFFLDSSTLRGFYINTRKCTLSIITFYVFVASKKTRINSSRLQNSTLDDLAANAEPAHKKRRLSTEQKLPSPNLMSSSVYLAESAEKSAFFKSSTSRHTPTSDLVMTSEDDARNGNLAMRPPERAREEMEKQESDVELRNGRGEILLADEMEKSTNRWVEAEFIRDLLALLCPFYAMHGEG